MCSDNDLVISGQGTSTNDIVLDSYLIEVAN